MRNVDVNKLIDNARFNAFHWNLLFWCALIIIFDGYDLVIYGVVLPRLMEQWALSPIQAGALGSYALFGMMFGALIFGPLSDRIGRKKAIAICVVLFSGLTFLNGFARTPTEFGICRFLAGLGIGGVMPNVVALMTEYSPKKMRSTLVAIMFSGYSVGGMMSAGLGMWLIPTFGWPSVFYVAVIPLLLLPVILRALPESPGFLLRQNRNAEQIATRAGSLHDQFVLVLESLDDLGKLIQKTQSTYDKARERLASGRGNVMNQIEQLRLLGAKTKKRLPAATAEQNLAADAQADVGDTFVVDETATNDTETPDIAIEAQGD